MSPVATARLGLSMLPFFCGGMLCIQQPTLFSSPKVGGSNPPPPTTKTLFWFQGVEPNSTTDPMTLTPHCPAKIAKLFTHRFTQILVPEKGEVCPNQWQSSPVDLCGPLGALLRSACVVWGSLAPEK